MTPEQARRKKIPVDHRTDIYSLGATMYQVLTGNPPFQGKDHQDTLSQIIERDPRPPRQHVQRIPGDLETIVLKCLRKDPGDRYGTAEALGQDLRRFVRGDPIEARPQSRFEVLVRRGLRHRGRILTVTFVFFLVTVVAWAEYQKNVESRRAIEAEYESRVLSAARVVLQQELVLTAARGQSGILTDLSSVLTPLDPVDLRHSVQATVPAVVEDLRQVDPGSVRSTRSAILFGSRSQPAW